MEHDTESDTVLSKRQARERIVLAEITLNDRVREKRLPFSWKSWEQYDTLVFGFTEVYFHNDFGVFRRGEEIGSLSVDYAEGTMIERNEDGNELRKQLWTATPITE